MVVADGRTFLNGTPIAVDNHGFVVRLEDHSLLPIKYQQFYRRAAAERARRMTRQESERSKRRVGEEG